MNPQQGYYQSGQQNTCMTYGNGGRYQQQSTYQSTYGGNGYAANPRPGISNRCGSNVRMQPTRTRSSNGCASNQQRSPPVFSSPSTGNMYNQQRSWTNGTNGNCGRPNQAVGRSVQAPQRNNEYRQVSYQQPQIPQHPLAPAQFCTPQAIKVNVTAEQLENAKNKPIYQDRGEASQDDNSNVKYIQLNWQDLLGGMENLRVSMVPSADPCNQNRQLKVSFGGQKTDPPQAGETALKVVSIEPAQSTGRMDIRQGNALAGTMKVCNPPAHLRMSPAAKAQNAGGSCYGNSCPR